MIEPITLGQARTHCPGLAADERGIIMGRKIALFFPDIARTVGFFRSYSRDVSLDEVHASLEIREAIAERGGREIMVRFEVNGSYAGDRAAQAARMHRGRTFTGTELHFVPFRDRRSPLGYDITAGVDLAAGNAALVLHGDADADKRTLGRSIQLVDLILGLSPRPLTAAERERETTDKLVIRCEEGLAKQLCRYLWSRQVRARVATAASAKTSVFSAREKNVLLVTCEGMPRHIAKMIAATPGLRLLVPSMDHLLVEWGYRHPIALESCGSAFNKDETILFLAPPEKVERLAVQEEAVDIADLVDVSVRGKDGVLPPPTASTPIALDNLGVELRLVRVPGSSGATTALLIERDKLPWFTKLVYMLPAAILRTYEAALTESHIVVVNRRGVHGIPFGEALTELYPQVFVPLGMQLLPRVDYELLREHLDIRPDQNLYFFPEGKPAFSVGMQDLKPLSRAVVAPERARASIIALRVQAESVALPTPQVVHKRQGGFSLWRSGEARDALEAREDGEPLALPPGSTSTPTSTEG